MVATRRKATAIAPALKKGTSARAQAVVKPPVKIATVSHTLDLKLAEHLREFAFRQRVSESAVIEHALRAFFDQGNDAELGALLRKAGATLRRRV